MRNNHECDPHGQDPVEILIVEDSVTQARHLAHLLSEHGGYHVRISANGAEGLAAARERRPTMIVSDISMPVMDGFTLCQQIKQDPLLRDVPVILLTSLTSLYDVIRGLDCGADNFLRKPFDSRYLLGRIRFILANRALRRDERVQLGMQVNLGGQTHFITAERQQIFDLLISTYEEAIQLTEQLKAQQERIARSYQSLQGMYQIAERLNPAMSELAVADGALDGIMDFPGVLGGCIALFDGAGVLRVVAAREMGERQPAPGAVLDCECAQRLADGALCEPEFVHECGALASTVACVPLSAGGRSLGLLYLQVASGMSDSGDLQVLDTIGNQIAIAVERAQLYANMESQVHERTQALRSERNLLSAVVETTAALVVLTDADGRIRTFNRAAEEAFGWPASEAIGRPSWEVLRMQGDVDALRRFYHDLPLDQLPPHLQADWLTRSGEVRSVVWSTSPLRGSDGRIEAILSTGMDITELRGAEYKLKYLSNYDTLTGLPNRVLLRDRMKQAQEQALAGGQVVGFLLLRFARMRMIRETLGAGAEQDLLLQVTRRLGARAASDTVARYNEGIFALVAVRAGVDELGVVARQLLAEMDRAFSWQQEELHLDPRVGITVFPNDGDDVETLAQGAENALSRAEASVGERCEFYRPEFNHGANERFRLESALRRAIEREEFLLHYQPQVDLRSGVIVGVEALVRWRHPTLGMVPPGQFIGLAEETGLILPIGEWVLRQACQQCRAWQEAGLKVVPVSVNLSARQFTEQIPDTVRRILDETGLEPRLLELELTETASMSDPQKSFEILRQLKDMGVRLAIDDFGTGYSNLNYLKRFPVDKLKLDQSFVRDLVSDPDDLSISRAVIALAHGLRLTVIAEGVESQGQLALLAANGCDEMQGYFFSRPVPAEVCEAMLRDGVALDLAMLARAPYRRTVLYVDEEIGRLAALRQALGATGCQVLSAGNAAEAFEILASTEVGVVLCEQRMACMDGTDFLARVRQIHPDVTRMVSCAAADLAPVAEAVIGGGVYMYVEQPWGQRMLPQALDEAFGHHEGKRGAH